MRERVMMAQFTSLSDIYVSLARCSSTLSFSFSCLLLRSLP